MEWTDEVLGNVCLHFLLCHVVYHNGNGQRRVGILTGQSVGVKKKACVKDSPLPDDCLQNLLQPPTIHLSFVKPCHRWQVVAQACGMGFPIAKNAHLRLYEGIVFLHYQRDNNN